MLSQFTAKARWLALKDFIAMPGQLDASREGLLLLTNDGPLQARISDPRHTMDRTCGVQVRHARRSGPDGPCAMVCG